MTTIIFWLLAGFTLAAAVMVVVSRRLMYSAVSLLFTLVGIAGLYIFLWADFIAVVQIVIYVGGITVLILFGIMLTNRIESVNISHDRVQMRYGLIGGSGLLILLLIMIFRTPWQVLPAVEPASTIDVIGRMLLIDYLLPFEVASLLLLAALIGAATLARRKR